MILVDTSIWVDFFNGRPTPGADRLDALLGRVPIAIGDVILAEVLQGFRRDEDFRIARRLLGALPVFDMFGRERAVRAAERYRRLRGLGVTVRRTTDAVIASFCIDEGHALLHADRDFRPFVEHFGMAEVV